MAPPRSGADREAPAWAPSLRLAGGLVALLALGPAAGHAASVLPDTDAALVPWADAAADANGPAGPRLDPAVLRSEIDLLLDHQIEAVELGDTPADGPPAGGLGAAVDLDMLSPGLPPNPRFPGYGLSFALPTGPSRAGLDEAHPATSRQAPQRGGGGGWFGLDADSRLAEPIGEVRAWVAEHRTTLLIALGAAALAVAAVAAVMRPVPGARPRRSRRRRSSSFGSNSRPAGHVGTGSSPAGHGQAGGRRRRRGADPADHRR